MERTILFPMGVRLSTWLVLGVFLVLGLRDRRYWLGAAAWLVGFELVFQITVTARTIEHGGFHPQAWWQPVFLLCTYSTGVAFLVFAAKKGVQPSLPPLGLSLLFWIIMLAAGLKANSHTMVHFNVDAEILNEFSKTLFALAYLWPLLAIRESRLACGRPLRLERQ